MRDQVLNDSDNPHQGPAEAVDLAHLQAELCLLKHRGGEQSTKQLKTRRYFDIDSCKWNMWWNLILHALFTSPYNLIKSCPYSAIKFFKCSTFIASPQELVMCIQQAIINH